MKKYVLTVSRQFPSTHDKAGEQTNFIEQIINKGKIHTIRSNYPLWEKRFKEIEKYGSHARIPKRDGTCRHG